MLLLPNGPDGFGWAATAVFAASYFFKQPGRLRLVQAAAAYGLLIHSLPVVVANLIVSSLALYSAWRGGGLVD